MKTAHEMAKLSAANAEKKDNENLEKISYAIESAAKEGKRELDLFKDIPHGWKESCIRVKLFEYSPGVLFKLKEFGYKVIEIDDDFHFTVKW